jgi:hypothetical protein
VEVGGDAVVCAHRPQGQGGGGGEREREREQRERKRERARVCVCVCVCVWFVGCGLKCLFARAEEVITTAVERDGCFYIKVAVVINLTKAVIPVTV